MSMFIFDRLLIGGLQFVLDKVAVTADRELNDASALRERLLDAQMQVELGELSDEAFREIEAEVVRRLRELRERREGARPGKIEGVSVEATLDHER